MDMKPAVLGWSRTRVDIPADAVVLDVGCGSFPNPAATVSCDMSLDEDRHRTGRATVVDRPFILCDATALPFRDGSIDFVIASHIAEHIDDPEAFCGELARVASAGYIETPSPLADYLLDEEYHQWRVGGSGSSIRFARKPAKPAPVAWWTDRFYRAFYAGREMGAPTYRVGGGPVGRVLRFVLYVLRGVLNRSGVMHTRIHFGPDAPLRCSVQSGERPRVTVVERGPASGFLAGDRAALEGIGEVDVVGYPGWPSPAFLLRLWSSTGRSEAVYTFFASEHAVPAAVIARLRKRRFVVSVGGYDTADLPDHDYGLMRRLPHRLIPTVVLRLADRVLAMSEAARGEAVAAGAPAGRTGVLHLGVDTAWADPHNPERDAGQIVTVAYVDQVSWSRKGIDRFVEAARRDPDHRYVLAGRVTDAVRQHHLSDPPSNLELTGYLSDDELRRLLVRSGVYVQLSWHEGFGVSMVEAMAAGCRPVISEVPALVEVAGPAAVVSEGPMSDVTAIGRAVTQPVDRAAIAGRARELTHLDRRSRGLRAALFAGQTSSLPIEGPAEIGC